MNIADVSVMIGMPVADKIPYRTHRSLLQTHSDAWGSGLKVCENVVWGCSMITKARSEVLHTFLKSDCTHLFWIDSDMVWTPKEFGEVLSLCATTTMHIVGSTYPAKREPLNYFVKTTGDTIPVNEYGCLQVEGMGLGFTCMRREVVERVAESKPLVLDQISGETIRDVFRVDVLDGTFRGEDMAFFADCRALGYDVWLYPRTNLGHVGEKVYTGDLPAAVGLPA